MNCWRGHLLSIWPSDIKREEINGIDPAQPRLAEDAAPASSQSIADLSQPGLKRHDRAAAIQILLQLPAAHYWWQFGLCPANRKSELLQGGLICVSTATSSAGKRCRKAVQDIPALLFPVAVKKDHQIVDRRHDSQ